jgi:hypothetical protein
MFQNALIKFEAWSTNATVGTWPLGCHVCQQWLRVTLPNITHQNPKPYPTCAESTMRSVSGWHLERSGAAQEKNNNGADQ